MYLVVWRRVCDVLQVRIRESDVLLFILCSERHLEGQVHRFDETGQGKDATGESTLSEAVGCVRRKMHTMRARTRRGNR